MDALPRPEELDQPAVKAYFEQLLRAYLETPAGRASTRVPSITELLDFAEAHPELAEAAASGNSAALVPPPPPPPPPSAELIPKESFVVKTREEGSERKVFVNVCSSPLVAAPGNWERGKVPPEVLQALEAAEQEGTQPLRLPLSLGAPREADGALVLDCVYADAVVQASAANPPLRAFLAQLALSHVAAKLRLSLAPSYTLPRRSVYDGPPRPQRVRLPGKPEAEKPLIAELPPPSASPEEPPTFALRFTPPPPPPPPPATPQLSFEGTPCTSMHARLPAPTPRSRLLLHRGSLQLLDESGAQLCAVPLPFEVDAEGASARLEGEELCVDLPVLPYEKAVRQAQAAAAQGRDLAGDAGAFLDLIGA